MAVAPCFHSLSLNNASVRLLEKNSAGGGAVMRPCLPAQSSQRLLLWLAGPGEIEWVIWVQREPGVVKRVFEMGSVWEATLALKVAREVVARR